MPQTADAMDGDEIAWAGVAVAERVEGGDPGAQKRRGLYGIEVIGRVRDGGDMGDHVRRIAAIARDAADFMHILAGETAVAPALAAISAGAAEPADAGGRADAPPFDAGADGVDDAHHLVAGNPRIPYSRPEALDRHHVAVADAAGANADPHFLRPRFGKVALLRLERSASLADDHRAHLRHRQVSFPERRGTLQAALGECWARGSAASAR